MSVNPHAATLLLKLDETYKAMQSFLTEFDEGTKNEHGNVSFSRHARFDFHKPDLFKFTSGPATTQASEPSPLITDGKHAYLLLATTPREYTEVPYRFSADTPFRLTNKLPYRPGAAWLAGLLTSNGIESDCFGMELKSLSSKPERLAGGIPVETVTGRWESPGRANDWAIHTYTIGTRDHLLYQTSIQSSTDLTVRVALFRHSQGDTLYVFTDDKLASCNAGILVKQTQEHTCTANILFNSGGIFPGEVSLVVDRKRDPNRVKRMPSNNFKQ